MQTIKWSVRTLWHVHVNQRGELSAYPGNQYAPLEKSEARYYIQSFDAYPEDFDGDGIEVCATMGDFKVRCFPWMYRDDATRE